MKIEDALTAARVDLKRQRLLDLADIIERQALIEFDMTTYGIRSPLHYFSGDDFPCGTAGCIAGTALALFDKSFLLTRVKKNDDLARLVMTPDLRAAKILNMSPQEARALFEPCGVDLDLVTPKVAAAVVRNFALTGEIAWPESVRYHHE